MEYASRLMVLPVRGVHWSDWGSEQRILNVLGMSGCQEQCHRASENESRQVSRKEPCYAYRRDFP